MVRSADSRTAEIVTDTDGITPDEFDALDRSAGAAGCYQRIVQRKEDRRWEVRFAKVVQRQRVQAMVPLYTIRGDRWIDQDYDPNRWRLPSHSEEIRPAEALFVGGCADLRSGLPITPGPRRAEVLSAALGVIAECAARESRALVFPYVYENARNDLDKATGGRAAWTRIAKEARFSDIDAPDRAHLLGSRVRGVLRRDRRLVDQAGLSTGVRPWAHTPPETLGLIAAHNIGKGQTDHPEFVRMRHDMWQQCESVEVIEFFAGTSMLSGVMSALVWRDELELYEIGLTGSPGPERMAVYISLLFQQPLAYALEHGLRNIRAGTEAEVPKSSRGARFADLFCGVLDADSVRKLAGGH